MSNNLLHGISLVMSEFLRSDISNVDDYVADRGPTRFFHGRKRVLGNFGKLVKESMEAQGGSTFLIQGAPGAGKTALLEEMALDALKNQWDVVDINLDDLYNPVHMAQTLGKSYVTRKQTGTKVDARVLAREHVKEVAGDSSVAQVLENMRPKHGVVLILDEAQRIGRFSDTPNEIPAMGTLDTLHNGKLPHPVILLAAGLGTTSKSFGSLGISRFKGGCFVELGALGKDAERAVIRDWLMKEGGAKGDLAPWIDAIVQNTHGWPHHIISYVYPASEHLKAGDGIMTSEGLHAVLEAGRKGRKAYYNERSYGFPEEERQGLAEAFADISSGESMTRKAILSSLARDFEPDEAKDLFRRAWEKGLLDERGGRYVIPIPSMQDWLISNYGRERISFPKAPQTSPALRERNSGLER
ncbi:MAG: ATP-binding protein [Bacteroidetes bacterium]|nr:ATP-binding protein [Bacteroidota bacterium]MCY3630476.1 ATP-binding protein [Bacteroidota bacterium]